MKVKSLSHLQENKKDGLCPAVPWTHTLSWNSPVSRKFLSLPLASGHINGATHIATLGKPVLSSQLTLRVYVCCADARS